MQMKRARKLSEEWGGKPCDHPAFAKLYDMGVQTGQYVCTQCGAPFTWREKATLLADREA